MSRNAQEKHSALFGITRHWPWLAVLMVVSTGRIWAGDLRLLATNTQTARVFTVRDPAATEAFRVNSERVGRMVMTGVTALTGRSSATEAWRSLVTTQDVVGIKVYSLPGPNSGTRPAVAAAVVEQLLAAGLPANKIIVWDRRSVDLRLAGFYDLADRYGIKVAGAVETGYDPDAYYESPLIGNLIWGDLEFGKKSDGVGRKSFYTKLVTRQITKLINISPMLNHNAVGVSGNLFSLTLGAVDNIMRFEGDPERLGIAIPDIYALQYLSDKVVLNITDALICQYEGGERGLLHYSAALNEMRFSRDPVALDVLSVNDLDHLRGAKLPAKGARRMQPYEIASLLELGVSDPKRIEVVNLESP